MSTTAASHRNLVGGEWVEAVEGGTIRPRIAPRRLLETHRGHGYPFIPVTAMPRTKERCATA